MRISHFVRSRVSLVAGKTSGRSNNRESPEEDLSNSTHVERCFLRIRRGATDDARGAGPPGTRAPRVRRPSRAMLLGIVVLAASVLRTLAMRGAFASRSVPRRGRFRRRGCSPPGDDASAPASGVADSDASTTILEADADGDDPGTDDDPLPSRPPSASSAPRRASSTIARTRLARRGAPRPLREALELDPEPPRRAHGARPRIRRARASTSTTPSRWTLFRRAAKLGDPGAHEELGFAHATGWAGAAENPALAVTHQYFAAMGGDPAGPMAMGYRHLRPRRALNRAPRRRCEPQAPASRLIGSSEIRPPGLRQPSRRRG